MSLHYNHDNSYLFINGEEILKFEADNQNVNFPGQFCLGSIYNGFDAVESREVSLKQNVYDFSVDCNAIHKADVLSIHNYLMVKDIINPYNCLLKNANFSVKTSKEQIISYIIK